MLVNKINLLASEAVNRFFGGESLNESILDIAEREDLNPQLLQRVIEKANEQTLLKKVAMGDNQTFPLADPETIFSTLNKPSAHVKTASSYPVTVFDYNPEVEKTAEDNHPAMGKAEMRLVIHTTMTKLAEEKDHYMAKCNEILLKVQKRTGEIDGEKVASFMESKLTDSSELGDMARKFGHYYSEVQRREKIIDYLEKNAGFWTSLAKFGLKGVGGAAKMTGNAVVNAGRAAKAIAKPLTTAPNIGHTLAKGYTEENAIKTLMKSGLSESKASKLISKPEKLAKKFPDLVTTKNLGRKFSPGRTMTTGFLGYGVYGAAKKSSNPEYVGSFSKNAGLEPERILNVIALAALGGLATTGASAAISGIRSQLDKKHFEQSFKTVLEDHPELGGKNELMTRRHFDSIARHSPSIAKDPIAVAPVLKQFQVFGGPDYKTIIDLRSTESKGGPEFKDISKGIKENLLLSANLLGPPKSSNKNSTRDVAKTASLHGIASSRVKTYFGDSPDDIARTKRKEIIGAVRGKTIGGALGGIASTAALIKSHMPLKAKLLLATAATGLGALTGRKAGEFIGGYNKSVSTPVRFNAPRSEILQAAINNIRKEPSANVYEHDVKRNIFLGV